MGPKTENQHAVDLIQVVKNGLALVVVGLGVNLLLAGGGQPVFAQESLTPRQAVPAALAPAVLPTVEPVDEALGFEDGRTAFLDGDAERAEAIWLSLVSQESAQAVEAKYGLASLYELGARRVDENPELAASLYGEACLAQIPDACTNLGVMYSLGRGVDEDNEQAVRLWDAAAGLGHCLASFNLGLAYYSGNGVEIDRGRAVDEIFKAADCQVSDAEYAVCQFYRLGLGVPENLGMALSYCQRASRQGDSNAQEIVGELVVAGVEPVDLSSVDRQGTPLADISPEDISPETADSAVAGQNPDQTRTDEEAQARQAEERRQQAIEAARQLAAQTAQAEAEAEALAQAGTQRLADPQAAEEQASPPTVQPPAPVQQTTATGGVDVAQANQDSVMFQRRVTTDTDEASPSVMRLNANDVAPSFAASSSPSQPQSPATGTAPAAGTATGEGGGTQQPSTAAATDPNCASVLVHCPGENGFPIPVTPDVSYAIEGENISETDLPVRPGFRTSQRPRGLPPRSELLALWLGSGEDEADAKAVWASIEPMMANVLQNPEPIYITTMIPAELHADGESTAVTRIYVGPVPSEQVGWQVCNVLALQNPKSFCKPWDVNAI